MVHPVAAVALAGPAAVVSVLLALASDDRPRRVLWSSVALAAAGTALRAFVLLPPIAVGADAHVAALRAALAAPLRTLVPEPESGLLLGIVLGDRSGISRDVRDAFAASGTAHLLAISGFHMSIVAGTVALILRGRVRVAYAALVTVLVAAGYTVLVGAGPSVVRSAIMATVGSLGLAVGRPGLGANGLGAAVTAMLIADPSALTEASFELSVGATAGLVTLQRPLAGRLARLPAPVAQALATTAAASAPTMPLVAAIFGRVSLISPLANLVAVPLLWPIMAFGAATAALGALAPTAAWPLAAAAYASATALRRAVEAAASVPLAALSVPTGAGTGLAVAALVLAASIVVARSAGRIRSPAVRLPRARLSLPRVPVRWRRVAATAAAVAVAALLIAGSAVAAASFARPASFRLHALDVGQGDAFLLESDGRYALVDGGPDPSLVLRRLGSVLPPWQRRIDLVALTHEHADHGAGLLGVIDRYDVGLAIEPAGMNDVPLARLWSDRLSRKGIARHPVSAGAVIRLGRATIRVLAPGPDRKVEVPSLVLHVSSPASSVLFMGDAVDDAIADVLLDPSALPARVYVPPHHGAATVHATALVAAVRPEAAVISVGALNKYGHPVPSTLAALGGLPVYRTDRYGTVDIDLDDRPLVVHTAASGLPPDRGGSLPGAPPPR